MPKKPQFHHEQTSMMIARTFKGDPVWRTDHGNGLQGRPFIIAEDGETMKPLGFLWWWKGPGAKLHFLPKPYLSYRQVAIAQAKSKIILSALRNGPIYMVKGFLKSRSGKVLTTRAISRTVLYWMEGCGIELIKEELKNGRTKIDIDVEATRKNKVS